MFSKHIPNNAFRLAMYAGIRARRNISTTAVRSMDQIDHAVSTMPPGYQARTGRLETITLPEKIVGTQADRDLGKNLGMFT